MDGGRSSGFLWDFVVEFVFGENKNWKLPVPFGIGIRLLAR